MRVEVRKATRDDAGVIADFAFKLVEQHLTYDDTRFSRIADRTAMANFYAGQTSSENASVLVAESDASVVGFAFLQYEPVLYAELATKVMWLHDIFVEDTARGRGIGNKLIDAVAAEAKRFGAKKVLLSVAAKNVAAQGFFGHKGFQTTMHEMMLVVGE